VKLSSDSQSWKPERVEVSVGQREGRAVPRTTRAVGTPGRWGGQVVAHTPLPQLGPAHLSPLPRLPDRSRCRTHSSRLPSPPLTGHTNSLSLTPALRNARINFSIRVSPTCWAIWALSWETRISPNPDPGTRDSPRRYPAAPPPPPEAPTALSGTRRGGRKTSGPVPARHTMKKPTQFRVGFGFSQSLLPLRSDHTHSSQLR